MSKVSSRSGSARRTAEAILGSAQKRAASFKVEQEREQTATPLKTARLRELRLAKEAEEKVLQATAPRAEKPRRSKQT